MSDIQNLISFMTSKDLRKLMSIRGKQLTLEEEKAGIATSALVMKPSKNAAITPWFKKLLIQLDGLDKSQGNPLTNDMPETKAERKVRDFVIYLLEKYSSSGKNQQYDPEDEVSKRMYDVDCWRNERSLRQQPPMKDQVKIVKEKFDEFTKTAKPVGVVEKLIKDKLFVAAVLFTLEMMPYFTSTDQISEINSYFASKHTNVGAPYFKNDKTLVEGSDSKTYADLCLEEANKVKGLDDLYKVITLFNRFKYLGGRPVLATSRIANMYFNQILKPAVEVYKRHCPFMWTYNDNEFMKNIMIRNKELTPEGYTGNNRDYTRYDQTISPDMKLLSFAMLAQRCRDYRGKRIIMQAAAYYCSPMQVCNGIDGRMTTIYPRQYSGELFTNFSENIQNCVETVYVHLLQDKDFIKMCRRVIERGGAPLLMMGDDNFAIESKELDDNKYCDDMKKHFGQIIYPLINDKAKGEKGYFVLQYRLYKENDNSYKYATPYPRIVQSLCIRERPTGLGYFGWCMMAFQQFERINETPEIQREIIRFFAELDASQFGTKLTPAQFKRELKIEDQAAQKEGKQTSAMRLYDGDPQRVDNFKLGDEVEWNDDYVRRMFLMVRKALSSGGKNR